LIGLQPKKMPTERQIIENENNFLNASLKVISRNQQWFIIIIIFFKFQKNTKTKISGETVNAIQALPTINYQL
jgi:hypothetical protein